MNQFFASLRGGTPAQQRQKKLMLTIIAVTAILTAICLITLGAVAIVNAVRSNAPIDDPQTPPTNNNGIPNGFVTTTFEENQLANGNLILTDDVRPYQGSHSLVLLSKDRPKDENTGGALYTILGWTTLSVTQETSDAFHKMFKDFYAQDANAAGELVVAMAANGADATATFQNGLTLSLKYYEYYNSNSDNKVSPITDVAAYKWIFTNAYKYGFVQLFPTDGTAEDTESREHIFRYVGPEHAKAMKDKKCDTLEDYIQYLQANTSAEKTISATVDQKNYRIYYIAKDALPYVPSEYEYVISGDNANGYIVTYCTTKTSTK